MLHHYYHPLKLLLKIKNKIYLIILEPIIKFKYTHILFVIFYTFFVVIFRKTPLSYKLIYIYYILLNFNIDNN